MSYRWINSLRTVFSSTCFLLRRLLASRMLKAALVAILPVALMPLALAAPRVASLDWTLAETLMALQAPPVALAQTHDYASWVGQATPESVVDMGLRSRPNLELLVSLVPDTIVISPMFASLKPRLSTIAPVDTFSMYVPDEPVWLGLETLTRKLGVLSEREAAAERLIGASRQEVDDLAERLPDTARPLIVVQFMDARHARVFGANSLFDAVMNRLGLENAWQQPTNAWGFSLVGIEQLAAFDQARFVVVKPYPVGVAEALEDSGLWQAVASVKRGDVVNLPAIWSFGGLPSATHFARVLTAAINESPSQAFSIEPTDESY
ncbi:ABC transporter substrate-binding protein [Halomonas halocynthiae]|uniref:ABC transporter substrate-binding protein n=1 Tax=Halomonas halocynthiae TaxID=176290 RepID=UPI001F0AD8E0|nr:ABC transporter substrate-binding protein [Halomonas halocynthiae]